MSNRLTSPAVVGILCLAAICVNVIPAQAAVLSYVSNKGTNSGNCSTAASPCLTLQYALSQTVAGGEIRALDAANYGPVVINKSITITGIDGAGIIRGVAGDAIAIINGAQDVNLAHLTIDGIKAGTNGIKLSSGGSLTIRNCTIRNFTSDGILLQPTTSTKFYLEDLIATRNGKNGINLTSAAVNLRGVILRTTSINNGANGLKIDGAPAVVVSESVFAENALAGIASQGAAAVRLGRTLSTGNSGFGLALGGAVAESAGDNFIRDNGAGQVGGTLTNVGMQ